MEFVMPAFACIVVVFGLIKRVPVFDIFLKGAKEGIQTLLTQGHEIYIVTSAHPDMIKWKAEWLQRELPEIPWSHVIVANNKSLIKGDILVDDGLHNLYEGSYIKVLFDKPWNRNVNKNKLTDIIHRVHNWKELIDLIRDRGEYEFLAAFNEI